MPDRITGPVIDDVVAEAMQLDLCFLNGPGQSRHVPFTFTPTPVSATTVTQLQSAAPLLGRLTQALAGRDELIQSVHAPLAAGDPFFAQMLSLHRKLHTTEDALPRVPLLLQRSDFMIDKKVGPRLVECNSIAAGMAPFGDHIRRLHSYIEGHWPEEYAGFSSSDPSAILTNPATANMATAIANAAHQLASELDHTADPGFLMVVQENEDNLFDQRLLERELQELGVRTYRRTFRQLHEQLSTGPKQSLQLAGCGSIHVVYLRAGYQYQDYVATDLDTRRCCDALCETRMFIERHRVAVNATIAQQLATSKRMQLHLVSAGEPLLADLGFDSPECAALAAVFAPMRTVEDDSATRLLDEGSTADWVLKNQGEGGGHCLFDQDILRRLGTMNQADYPAWVLMRRLRPRGRVQPTWVVRDGLARQVEQLVSEIGMFSAHLGDQALPTGDKQPGHIGYLVRSKGPDVTEAGVHSGFGALDSLALQLPE